MALANSFKLLLNDDYAVDAMFKEYDRLVNKVITLDPMSVTPECLDQVISKQNTLSKSFTKEGSPNDFKKTWKYAEIFNWCQEICEVVQKEHLLAEAMKKE